jgi:hypothetical protein
MDVGKTKDVRISSQPSPTDCDTSKTAEECGIVQLFVQHDDK